MVPDSRLRGCPLGGSQSSGWFCPGSVIVTDAVAHPRIGDKVARLNWIILELVPETHEIDRCFISDQPLDRDAQQRMHSVSKCRAREMDRLLGPPSRSEALMDGITFIGTATTIVRLGSFTVLTDPNFLHRGQRAYLGKGLWSRRLTEPAMQPAGLPVLNAVVLSHLHGDHFDRIARRELDRTVPVVTTEQAASRLRRYGFTSHGMQPWNRYELTSGEESLTVESLPAIHAYGLIGKMLPPVMGSLLVHRASGAVRRRVYLSGDTLTGDHLDEISERHPDIDTAVVHLGGTRILFWTVTMDANQGVEFLQRVRPRLAVPVHYDDYRVFRSPLSDFLSAIKRDLPGQLIEAPVRGGTVPLGD
jgi:L-ascorbate metabolism protein UlaG (beta-lactamase superfamily)